MVQRLTFVAIALFWIVMNVLLWRSEFGRGESGAAIPVATVWQKMLTAPDNSSLTVLHKGKRVGFCRWSVNVGQELSTGQISTEEYAPEGRIEKLTGYTIDLEGGVALGAATNRLTFDLSVKLSTNQVWREVRLRSGYQRNIWEIRSNAGDETVRLRVDNEGQRWDSTITFAELQNPEKLLAELVGPRRPGHRRWTRSPNARNGGPGKTFHQPAMGSAIRLDHHRPCASQSLSSDRPTTRPLQSFRHCQPGRRTHAGRTARRHCPDQRRHRQLRSVAMIELIHLVKKFGDLTAVNDINLTVEKGEFFAVLGPNAAGKTTTLRILAGLIKPTSGSARIAGFDVQSQPLEARQRLAYVPDFPFLYDKLSPWEFFRFSGQLFQMSEERIQLAARELIPRFGLEEFINKPIEGLSHGTRQRVAIVSALMHEPEVFVIDEPMVGLDPQHARVVKDVLKERSQRGMTVFLSTHQLSVAEEMADRIGIIHQGRLVAVGTDFELRRQGGVGGALEQAFLALTNASTVT